MVGRAEAAGRLTFDLGPLGPLFVAELLLLGTVVGFLAGMLGIGGGMMMVPIITLLLLERGVEAGLAVKMAIATSGASILFTSVSSLLAHHRHGAVRWPLVAAFAPGIAIGGVAAGAGVLALVRGQWLAIAFAAFNAIVAWRMWTGGTPKGERGLPGPAALVSVGAVIGFICALVGAGGAFLSVPFMTRCSVPMREAVGTSAALGFPVALASTVGYVAGGWSLPQALPGALGYLYLPGILIVALASVLMAPLGARMAHRMPVARLRRAFGLLLGVLAAYMAWQAMKG
ncbi:MAG: sulfite exporter TauE/SafE family protein [Rubrivivax sp.]|nr:sulfite exporter TauE/SafE family protein [Rubrivivax sp.]